ncbi:bacteriocin immunity protein [Companilactobacillus ginsenosidimutans]|uniref:Prebacteriocin n=1 Tax=Companilactobacillus ginsenosidimutans TaxID=1007676 RepID=A0A0H4QHQ1_9LACO|nr:bacteriocin immunity protein [Companilactobacillus ginsenosidimutans]AKP67477.1 prebacteriocin [Companilactobacillus ginsenosidimutans]
MAKNDEKVEQMLDQLSKAYSDPEVQKRADLKTVIFNSAQQLEKNRDPDLTSSKLCKSLTLAYLAGKEGYPKAAIILFNQLKGKEVKYDGVALASLMMPVWF